MEATTPPSSPRWRALDGVRGAAVLAVVGWHVYRLTLARGMSSGEVPPVLWPLGVARLGVDVFFVLSGLLVVRSWHDTRRRAAGRARATWDFLRRRARRILPAYWLSLAVLLPLVGARLLDDPRRLLAFATLNQYVRFWLPEKVNPVTWSLTTEWHFYLLVPLVAWLLTRVGRWPLLAACTTLSVAWWLHTPLLLPASFVFGRLDQFLVGAIVGQLVAEPDHPITRAAARPGVVAVAGTGALALGTYHGATLGMANHMVFDAFVHPLFGMLAALLLLRLLTRDLSRIPAEGALAWFGTISFGLYLWHYPILDQGLRWARASTALPPQVVTVLAVPALCACAVGAAKLSYVLVERPFLTRGNAPSAPNTAGTLDSWPSRRSSASRPNTA